LTLGNLVSGPGQLVKSGAGSVTLSGANTHSGGLVVGAGTVNLGSDTAAGSGSIALNATGTLQAVGTRNIANNVVLGGGAIGGTDNLTLSGVVSGSSALTKNGSGTLHLANANSASGSVAVNAGTLALGANGALGSVSSVSIASGATLTLDAPGGNLINNAAAITFAGGTFNANNYTETLGALNLTGSSILNLLNDSDDADLTFASFGSLTGGAVLTINGWTGNPNLTLPVGGTGDRVFFLSALSAPQLAAFSFTGNPQGSGAFQLPSGEIVPVPEPSTWALIGASLAAIPFLRRKRS
jgi:autotransporter-associated beta strand protein